MPTPHGAVVWSELMTHDVEAAKSYFAAICGWSYDDMKMDDGSNYTIAIVGGQPVAGLMDIAISSHFSEQQPHWMTYFAVDDVDAAVAQTSEQGGEVLQQPVDIPGVGRIAMLKDPSGATMGLITEAQQG